MQFTAHPTGMAGEFVSSSTGFNSLRKKSLFFVIPRRAARRGISLLLRLNQREIPHFVRNDKINYFFRSLFSLMGLGSLAKGKLHRLKPVLQKRQKTNWLFTPEKCNIDWPDWMSQ
jgi:hypothetical protein